MAGGQQLEDDAGFAMAATRENNAFFAPLHVVSGFQTHGPQAARVAGPVLAHLDEQKQCTGLSSWSLSSSRASRPMCLDGLAAFAQHNLPLTFTFDIDHLLDADRAVGALFPFLGFDRRFIGQFLVKPIKYFFARDLGGQEPQRQIGKLIARDRAMAPPA